MKITRLLTMALMAGTFSVGAAQAQIKEQQPAEFPPSSYKGKQYVDSQGCVFIRAGIDGDVSWVPRVTRSRKTICGFTPSLSGQQVAAAKPAAPASVPVQITLDNAAPATPAPVAAAKPVVRKAAKPRRVAAPKVVRQVAPRKPIVRATPKPPLIVEVEPTPAAPKRVATRQVTTACPGASPLSQRYLRGDGRAPVRCGPQAGSIIGQGRVRTATTQPRVATVAPAAEPVAPITVSPNRRIVPRHVAINRLNTTDVRIPHGYKRAWEDDRLNPKRAEQTLAGRSDMLMIWTNTVPRRLINQTTGQDVTASVPLVYPYLDTATQERELGQVTIVRRGNQLLKRILRNTRAKPVRRKATYSTRSAPKAQVAPAPKARVTAPAQPAVGGKKFVQIGYFTTRAKADKAAQHLAGMGMKARIGKVRKGGKTYLAVQAGPFNGNTATQNAVSRLRGIGYSGAVARN